MRLFMRRIDDKLRHNIVKVAVELRAAASGSALNT